MMMVWLLHGVAVWLALLAPARIHTQADGSPPDLPEISAEKLTDAVVVEVLDGDSLVLLMDGELRRLELLGADAADWTERHPRPSPESVIARRFLIQLLEGERVGVYEPEPGIVDQVGRRRGYVYRQPDGLLVDLEVVRQGYGRVSIRAEGPWARVLRWYELRARELERGIWGDPQAEPAIGAEPAKAAPSTTEGEPPSEPSATDPSPTKADDSGWVWVTDHGSRYHRETCAHARSSGRRIARSELDPGMQPCKACEPDG